MQFKDYYQVLGVEASAGDAEIKTAYRRLARKYHPDVSKEAGAEDRFKEINEAYEALRDGDRRKAYDSLRARGYRPGDEVHSPGAGFGGTGAGYEDIFAGGGAAGGFSDFFEEMFGRRHTGGFGQSPGSYSRGRPNTDTRARLAVSLEAVYRGDTVAVTVGGRKLNVKVPQGVRAGQSIRLKGQGTHGDLLLELEYAAHPDFDVDGRNIIHVLAITPWQAALGASLNVPTLGGAVQVKIPAGSESGRKLRLRGRGLPATLRAVAGDQIIELEVLAPVPANDTQRKAYEDLRDAFAAN